MTDGTPMVEQLAFQNLSLRLGSREVLNNLSVTLHAGEVVGLLGPNGSGKTSLFRCLLGLYAPASGMCRLMGQQVLWGDRRLRRAVGVVFQEPSLDKHLSAMENLLLGARLYGIRGEAAATRAMELLSFVDLTARAHDRVLTYSGGMRRRLEIARALIADPQILLLDEPTAGLDPPGQSRVWQRLLALRKARGLSLLVATHSAEEAALCDRVIVLDAGKIVANETPERLLTQVAGDLVTLSTKEPAIVCSALSEALGLRAQATGETVTLTLEDGAAWVPRLVEAAGAGRIQQIRVARPSLATVFASLTGRDLVQEAREG